MAQSTQATMNSGRALAQARRKAMSSAGKTAAKGSPARTGATSNAAVQPAPSAAPRAPVAKPAIARTSAPVNGGRAASLARRRALSSQGKNAVPSSDRTRSAPAPSTPTPAGKGGCGCGCKERDAKTMAEPAPSSETRSASPAPRNLLKRKAKVNIKSDTCRATALARRKAQSTRGKAGISKSGMTAAQTARASNPELSGRELARTLRDQKSRKGSAGQKKSSPTGRMRPARKAETGAAQDAPWKVGASDTSHGQTVTGTMVGRSESVTGDEASTCRTVTGTEYLGADIFKQFCQAEPAKSVSRGGTSATTSGNSVTGNRVGRSSKVTGDEPGTCKNVTGTEYVGAEQSPAFCGTPSQKKLSPMADAMTRKGKTISGDNVGRSSKVTGDETGAERELTGTQYTRLVDGKGSGSVPPKVGNSKTLSGGSITGSMVGRREKMTGDEAGSCRNVTGDDYIGAEQFSSFCKTQPERSERKVGQSKTFNGESVTGTMTGRGSRVTGDEPGTCKSITGTPYAGAEQYQAYCEPKQTDNAAARMRKNTAMAGAPMTGLQPAVGGKMTGDSKGACESVSGTPYVGRDQVAEACPASAAEMQAADFPQSLEQAIGADFSVSSPAREAQTEQANGNAVTGSRYEQGSSITGPFGMASGKVTGTEQARFDRAPQAAPPVADEPEMINNRPTSRITGEGMDAGPRITGDDWERGDRVTGTEGKSATRRNPTLRGPTPNAMQMKQQNRNEEMPMPVSKVTGGSGNTDRGALITYSGGARG
jgi:hypothetical protein